MVVGFFSSRYEITTKKGVINTNFVVNYMQKRCIITFSLYLYVFTLSLLLTSLQKYVIAYKNFKTKIIERKTKIRLYA